MSSWKFVPEVTEVKVVESAKYVFELTEAEAKGLYALLADGVGVQTRRRLGLYRLLMDLRGARNMQGWITDVDARPDFVTKATLKGPFHGFEKEDVW